MPPKPRGRGGRGRGTGRGGAAGTSGRGSSTAPPEIKPEPSGATGDLDSKPVIADLAPSGGEQSGVAPTIETGSAGATTSSSASASQAAPDTARPTPARLDSLKSSTPASRSSSPARRGSTRGKKPTFNPTFTGRRSKTEREALEKLGKERDKARLKEVEDEKNAREREKRHDEQNRRKFNANRPGRGGFSGVPSGPFSLGSVAQDRRKAPRDGGSGSRATRVKREDDDDMRPSGGSSRPSGIKDEDDMSSDEDEVHLPRRNIDRILIEVPDDEAEPSEDKHRVQQGQISTGLPVRIARKDEEEGSDDDIVITGETRKSSQSSGPKVKKEPGEAAPRKGKAKAKSKAKDLEITEVRKPYKGMWQDSEESSVKVKAEPISEDEEMPDAVPVGLSAPTANKLGKQPVEKDEKKKSKKKPKIRKKALKKPIIQTKEDAQEWNRYLVDRKGMLAELGPEHEPETDVAGDTKMKGTDNTVAEPKLSVRDNNPYVFQLPPGTPDVLPIGVKVEPELQPEPPKAPVPKSGGSTSKTPIKVEEGTAKGAKNKRKRQRVVKPKFTHGSGVVGTIRLHASGITTSSWGAASFELDPGRTTNFFEEVASRTLVPPAERVVPEDAGESFSLGRVKGKFIMVPEWLV